MFSLAQDANERVSYYEQFFLPHGRVENQVSVAIDSSIHGLKGVRNLKEVIKGTLYRAGAAGGRTGLSESALTNLCIAGFSKVFYFYPDGFVPQNLSCITKSGKTNHLSYVMTGFTSNKNKATVMESISEVIKNPTLGPVLVHCWNGYHASGEIAATALVQFCDWSGNDATEYWWKNQNGAKSKTTRIKNYPKDSLLEPSKEVQNLICPTSKNY